MQSVKDREKEIWDAKERTPPTLQLSMLIETYLQSAKRDLEYMMRLLMIFQGRKTAAGYYKLPSKMSEMTKKLQWSHMH